MTNLSNLLNDIQRPEKSHVDMIKRHTCGTFQWFLEKDNATHPIHDNNQLEFFVCGEEGFGAIEQDIRKATSSIDLVLWGFDPGMELSRQRETWPHGTTYGELLVDKARSGVKVRMLIWWNSRWFNSNAKNVPDFPWWWRPASWSSKYNVEWPGGYPPYTGATTDSALVLQLRHDFCVQWWKDALSGSFENLEIRVRSGKAMDTGKNLIAYLPDSSLGLLEDIEVIFESTHHQKPILIDYMPIPGKVPNTCGYVMGLNSVTDYWDTDKHQFNDPLRELSPNAHTVGNQKRWHLKPYRDYAIRIQGEALYSINENFVQGWDNAHDPVELLWFQDDSRMYKQLIGYFRMKPHEGKLAPKRQHIQPKELLANAQGGSCRVQIQRTQPEWEDGTILKGYTLASANAMSYIYVENQYFQLPEWPQLLRDVRKKYLDAMKEAGEPLANIAPLYLFVVIPQAERAELVPKTYETVGGLGVGDLMDYNEDVQGERAWEERKKENPGTAFMIEMLEQMLPPVAWKRTHDRVETSASVRIVPDDIQAQIKQLGIKPLVAMLMSYDGKNEAKDIRVNARDGDAQEAQADKEAQNNKDSGINQGKADDVEQGNSSDYNIIPKRYREIYIHSKLMIVDDVYLTLGSANLNVRSMVADSELNLCMEEYTFTQKVRQKVWKNLAGADLDGGSLETTNVRAKVADTHKGWLERMKKNSANRIKDRLPENDSFIHIFEDPRRIPWISLA